MATKLANKKCVPCTGGVPALKGKALKALHKQVPKWSVVKQHHITRAFKFPDFKQALKFVNRVGALAETQGIIRIFCWPGARLKLRCGRTRWTGSRRAISSWRRRLTGWRERATGAKARIPCDP